MKVILSEETNEICRKSLTKSKEIELLKNKNQIEKA